MLHTRALAPRSRLRPTVTFAKKFKYKMGARKDTKLAPSLTSQFLGGGMCITEANSKRAG